MCTYLSPNVLIITCRSVGSCYELMKMLWIYGSYKVISDKKNFFFFFFTNICSDLKLSFNLGTEMFQSFKIYSSDNIIAITIYSNPFFK